MAVHKKPTGTKASTRRGLPKGISATPDGSITSKPRYRKGPSTPKVGPYERRKSKGRRPSAAVSVADWLAKGRPTLRRGAAVEFDTTSQIKQVLVRWIRYPHEAVIRAEDGSHIVARRRKHRAAKRTRRPPHKHQLERQAKLRANKLAARRAKQEQAQKRAAKEPKATEVTSIQRSRPAKSKKLVRLLNAKRRVQIRERNKRLGYEGSGAPNPTVFSEPINDACVTKDHKVRGEY